MRQLRAVLQSVPINGADCWISTKAGWGPLYRWSCRETCCVAMHRAFSLWIRKQFVSQRQRYLGALAMRPLVDSVRQVQMEIWFLPSPFILRLCLSEASPTPDLEEGHQFLLLHNCENTRQLAGGGRNPG